VGSLPMLQYSEKAFSATVQELVDLTKQIDNLLSIEKKLNLQQIESLDVLYKKRAKPLKILETWMVDEELKEDFHKKHSKVLKDIVDNDKVQVDRINVMLSKRKNDLKKITDKKSLLIYSRAK
jgi:N-methylhydantoinase A/oxoprolinase/acetone carboxylase beta subunit